MQEKGPEQANFSNTRLILVVLVTLVAAVLSLLFLPILPTKLAKPGSPLMQTAAISGSLLLIISFCAVLSKRVGGPGRTALKMHILMANFGLILLVMHSGGKLFSEPGTLLLLLFSIIGLGVWLRISIPSGFAAAFGTKMSGFSVANEFTRSKLRELICKKETLLGYIDPTASEAVFSLTPKHWLICPILSFRYQRLVARESHLIGHRQSVNPSQAYCRLLHRMLSWVFLAGLIIHVITVTFFAGYVADGREIYWWHLTDWGS